MNKYLTEFVGTFFLVLTIGCTVIPGATGVIPPIAIGAALMVLVFAGGHISGAHYNPAVTLAVWMRGRCDTKDLVPYWVSQLAGAAEAAGAAGYLVGPGTPMTIESVPHAIVAEFADQPFDDVVTVCDRAAQRCPVFGGSGRRTHWSLPDPTALGDEEQQLAAFRQVRDELAARLPDFLAVPADQPGDASS